MRLQHHCWLVAAILSTISILSSVAQKKEKPPKWKEGSDPVLGEGQRTTIEGTELKLVCSAKGVPRPDIMWLKDDEPFFPRTDKIRMKGSNLKFMELEVSDRGNYTCVASNAVGRLEFTFIVDVIKKVWPLETDVSANQTVYEGETAKFFCIVTNDPTARIQWLRIPPEDQFGAIPRHEFLKSVEDEPEILLVPDVTQADAGQYTCLVGNEFGSKYQHMYLTVLEPTTSTTTTMSTTTTTTTSTTTTTTPTTTTMTTSTTTTTPTTTTTTPTTTTTTLPITIPPTTMTTTEEYFFQPPTAKPKKKNKKKDKKKKKDQKKKNKNKKNKKNKKDKDDMNRYEDGYGDNTVVETNDPYSEDPYSPFDPYGPYIPDNTGNNNEYNRNSDVDWYEPKTNNNDAIQPYDPDFDNNIYEPSETDDNEGDYRHGSGARNATAHGASTSTSGISVWTVYIIVGSIAGGILLAGLVAIAIALCCQKEEEQPYKSTSV